MILITGHKGYIGNKLFDKLKTLGYDVCGIDLTAGPPVENGDIRTDLFYDGKTWYSERPEVIFHLAAKPSVQWSIDNPSEALSHNVLGTSRVLEFAMQVNCRRVIFASSAAVYGNNDSPDSPYGIHKLMSEYECKLYSELYDIDTVALRYYNVYSEDQPYGGSYSTVISAWMEMIRNNRSLRIDGDGSQTRDFIHVDDIVAANIFCMNYEKKFRGSHYDVGTGLETSLNDLKEKIDTLLSVRWEYTPARIGDITNSIADTGPLEQLGWTSKIDITEGLQNCFKP
jgi:UDP-glucose 4-epimerase